MSERLLFRVDVVEHVCECDICKAKDTPVTTTELRYSAVSSDAPPADRLAIVSGIAQLGQSMAQWACPELKIGGEPRETYE